MGAEGPRTDEESAGDTSLEKLRAECTAHRYALASLFALLAERDPPAAARATLQLRMFGQMPMAPLAAAEIEAISAKWSALIPRSQG